MQAGTSSTDWNPVVESSFNGFADDVTEIDFADPRLAPLLFTFGARFSAKGLRVRAGDKGAEKG